MAMLPARLFLAFGWLRAGIEKLIDRRWWTGAELQEFLVVQGEAALPFAAALGGAIAAFAPLVATAVVVIEVLLGVCLLTRRHLRAALWAAIALNTVFVCFGVVSPSAFYLVLQMSLLLHLDAGAREARRRYLTGLGASALVVLALVPFVQTVHPAEVIDDPALMLATVAALYGVSQLLGALDGFGRIELSG